jgi:hypothetical protein
MNERAFIERVGEVVWHVCFSQLNKKGYQSKLRPQVERRERCVGKGNRKQRRAAQDTQSGIPETRMKVVELDKGKGSLLNAVESLRSKEGEFSHG